MASTKDIFEAKIFAAGIFAAGIFRGGGVDIANVREILSLSSAVSNKVSLSSSTESSSATFISTMDLE